MKFSSFQPPALYDADGRRRYSTLPPSKGLKATKWGTKRAPKVANWRDNYLPLWMTAAEAEKLTPFEKAWLAWVRLQPCIVCGRAATRKRKNEASHVTISADQKGHGMKVPTRQTVPHCPGPNGCHRQWDGRRGFCRGWSKERRYHVASAWVEDMAERADPGDRRDHALALQAAGLLTVVDDGDGRWSWLPGDADERRAA